MTKVETDMFMSNKGLKLVKEFEGCVLHSYQDRGGVWTIGWGHTERVSEGLLVTQRKADEWLERDVGQAASAVNLYVRGVLNQNQFDAIVDFVFNLGVAAFRSSTLLRRLNEQNWAEAGKELLRWENDNGVKVAGLTRRREAEKKLFDTPILTKG